MSDSSSKILSIRLQKELLEQLEDQACIQKLTLSDFVRQELSLVEKRIRDNELLKNKIVILLRQIYGVITEQVKNKVDLSKFEEIQAHSEKVQKELQDALSRVSLLLGSNKQMKELLDLKISIIQKYEDQAKKKAELADGKAEQVDDNDIEPEETEEEVPLKNTDELAPLDQTENDVPDDDGTFWSGLEGKL